MSWVSGGLRALPTDGSSGTQLHVSLCPAAATASTPRRRGSSWHRLPNGGRRRSAQSTIAVGAAAQQHVRALSAVTTDSAVLNDDGSAPGDGPEIAGQPRNDDGVSGAADSAAASLADAVVPADDGAGGGPTKRPEDGEKALQRAADLLRMVHLMVPADVDIYNPAMVLWKAIRSVPAHLRPRLLDTISASDIERLWHTSNERYMAPSAVALEAIGPRYSQWQDFPEEPGQVVVFEGRAAVMADRLAGALRLNRFQKLFFLHPHSDELMGRVDVGAGALGRRLYPLYFRGTVKSSIVPTTSEIADIQLEYLPPPALQLTADDLPEESWPTPGKPRSPFHGQLSDYLRAVGPGVYVGAGWRAPRPEKRDAGRRFLTFMMVRRDEG